MEQIRLIKEMRAADEECGKTGASVRPRFMVWENVPGAFSSNKGLDFGAVLQETLRIVKPKAPAVPMSNSGWPMAGCLFGAGNWSIAWRILDAQFWGVPQRRRRIALVADFGGERAPEVLFEREGVSWDYPSCGTQKQATAGGIAESTDRTKPNALICASGFDGYNSCQTGDVSSTLGVNCGMSTGRNGVFEPVYALQGNGIDFADTATFNGKGWREGQSYTLNTVDRPAIGYDEATQGENDGTTRRYRVRRLTPLECERLQGYPDGWTNIGTWTDSRGKKHTECTDTERYRALGNSIAIPPWTYVLQRLSLCCETDKTMASLFDGIGGFPLIWERLNGRGTCLWASEIEDFPIAVTKKHFA